MGLDNSYEVFIPQELEGVIQKNLPQQLRKVLERKIQYLANNPHYPSLNTKKYHVSEKKLRNFGVDEVWEFYINRHEYRCIFYVIHSEKKIIIAYVGNHKDIVRRYT